MIKLLGKYLHRVINYETGDLEITFTISDYNSKANTDELEKELYSIEIKKPRSKRSLNQNAYLWSLVHELALKMDEDEMDVYIKLIGGTKVKYEVLKVLALSLIHISEPTRQAEISYAVFCLKKKKQKK